jgi:hypothetical protein
MLECGPLLLPPLLLLQNAMLTTNIQELQQQLATASANAEAQAAEAAEAKATLEQQVTELKAIEVGVVRHRSCLQELMHVGLLVCRTARFCCASWAMLLACCELPHLLHAPASLCRLLGHASLCLNSDVLAQGADRMICFPVLLCRPR